MKISSLKYFIVCIILIACNKNQGEDEYYPSGNIKLSKLYGQKNDKIEQTIYYYDLSGEKKFKVIYHKQNFDSVVYYYDNTKIFKTGKQDKKENLFGKWKYYTKEGFLSDYKEFFLINNKFENGYRLNQIWYLNKKGDTMYYGSNKFNVYKQKEFESESQGDKTSIFVRFDFYPKGDTSSIAKPFTGLAEDGYPFWEKRNSESYIVLAKENYNFNKNFSNEKQVKLDTFLCLEKDKINKNSFPGANQKHTVAFGRWFDTSGKKTLRGYMVEHYKRKATPDDSIVSQERRTYFEKIIYIKDTVK